MFFLSLGEVRRGAHDRQVGSLTGGHPYAGIRSAAADYPGHF